MPDDVTGITLRNPTDETLASFLAPLSIAFGEEFTEAEIENDARSSSWIGSSAPSTATRRSAVGRVHLPADDAGRRGRRRRDHAGRRPADPSAARDPAPDDDLAVRPGARARRAGRDPVGVRGGDLPAVRLRHGDAPDQIDAPKDKIVFARPVEPHGRVRIVDRDEAAERFPPIYEARRATTPGSLNRTDAKWRYAARPRRRVDAQRQRAQGPRAARGRRRGAGLRHLPDQGRLGQPRAEERRDDPRAARRRRRRRSRRSGSGCSASTWSASSGRGAARCPTRCS